GEGRAPWKLEKRRLKVLCCEIKVGDLDQLSYKVGRTCVPVVAPEFRIFQLLRLHYQATRQMRALDFGVVPEEGRVSKRKKAKDAEKVVQSTPELIDESAFNEIYDRIVPSRPPSPAAAVQPTLRPGQHPAASWQAPHGLHAAPPPMLAPIATPSRTSYCARRGARRRGRFSSRSRVASRSAGMGSARAPSTPGRWRCLSPPSRRSRWW